jgi:3-isopropylmalate dehydrogenase
VVDEERRRFPDVEVNHQLVDSCAMLLVRRPADFDVIVTENLFGDILSDEAAVLAGSLGMLPSASLADRLNVHGGTFGLYEPIHGSAPDIAGDDRANPVGTILSAAMMFFSSFKRSDVSSAIEAAVSRALDEGWRTADLADPADQRDGLVVVGTTGFATAVIEALEASAGVAA